MTQNGLKEILARVGAAKDLDAALYADMIAALKAAFPDEAWGDAPEFGDSDPTSAMLRLINTHLPDWSISLKGKTDAVDGSWTCTLRKSDLDDDDLYVGTGGGAKLPLALMAAFVKLSLERASR